MTVRMSDHKRRQSAREGARLGHMVKRIVATVESATDQQRGSGEGWYGWARQVCESIDPVDPDRAARVLAILSPRCPVEVNIAWARMVIEAAREGRACPAVSTLANRRKAWAAAWRGTLPTGDKVSRFYRNIMGDVQCVTVDVWTARVAEGPTWRDAAPAGRRYALIERAYQVAAGRLGITPRECQAVAWTVISGN